MNKRLIICVIIMNFSNIYGEFVVQLPHYRILHERLSAICLPIFLQATGFVGKIAGKQMTIPEIIKTFNESLSDFNHYLICNNHERKSCNQLCSYLRMAQYDILEVLLQDSPEALKELQGMGFQ